MRPDLSCGRRGKKKNIAPGPQQEGREEGRALLIPGVLSVSAASVFI